ncbi:phosphoenolpyruvate--protein phosphotransferase [Verrucomicrobiales bacterium]|nr:phosphoenolpyruvate--protein phosphotransferase [Verrucomicrobiales bacterium]
MTSAASKPETRIQGIGVSPGISWGLVEILSTALEEPEEASIERSEVESEINRLSLALVATREQISELQKEIISEDAENSAAIFDAHLLLLEDATVLKEVQKITESELKTIDWAYFSVVKRYIDSLRKIADPYLRERAVDIEDVAKRVLGNLRRTTHGAVPGQLNAQTNIVLSHDLTPSDTVSMDRSKVRGFATEAGSQTSHTAIMARSLNIAAVVAIHKIPEGCSTGDTAIVDGHHGLVILNPSPETLADYKALAEKEKLVVSGLDNIKDAPTETSDGVTITLSANIEFLQELSSVADQGAEGIGLYRTEFFYLSNQELRSEENQTANYREVAEATAPHGVIIRTLDIGGDKMCPELYTVPEPNPFLGWRGIRLSLDRPADFRIQLRSILKASAVGKVRVMFPFISTLEEVQRSKQHLEAAKTELRDQGIPFDEEIEVGAMIEIPSAVMIADHIAREVDFLSIGTNDLIQYTTAVDRVNDRVAGLYQPTHPAVIALIRETVEAAHRNNIWCGICGEAASDLRMTPIWVGLGVDELSVGSAQLLKIRHAISKLDSESCGKLVEELRAHGTAGEIERHCINFAKEFYPEFLI